MCFRFQLGIHAFELGELCFQTLGVMLLDRQSIAFRPSEHCFRTVRALLSDSQSIAFRPSEQCFRLHGVCLWTIRSNAPDGTEHASIYIQSTAPDDTEQCSNEYKDTVTCYYSTMTRPPMGWRVTRAWPFWSTFKVFFTGVGQ